MSEIIQRSPEWYAARLGKVTASRTGDLTAKTKTGYSTSRMNYAAELILERLTGLPTESYVSPAMQHGMDMEPEARAAYSFHADCDVEEVGFVEHPRIMMAGASPDGLIGADGLVEIKVPNPATHMATLLGSSITAGYLAQANFQMACTGREWVDWVSYCPAFPDRMRLYVQRIARDADKIAVLETEVGTFLEEVERKVDQLSARYLGTPSRFTVLKDLQASAELAKAS
jgi:putative phage-type endonuclease